MTSTFQLKDTDCMRGLKSRPTFCYSYKRHSSLIKIYMDWKSKVEKKKQTSINWIQAEIGTPISAKVDIKPKLFRNFKELH
jgi:hypothetical protein